MRPRKNEIGFEDILRDYPSEENLLEVPFTDRMFKIFFTVAFLLAIVIVFQLSYLNIANGEFYEKRSNANMSDVRVRFAPRGIITDRFGTPLLHNESVTRVSISPLDFPKDTKERIEILEHIAGVLHMDVSEIREKIDEKNWGQSDKLFITDSATHDEIVELASLNISGIIIESAFKRVHEDPFAFSHVLGYTGLVNEADLSGNEDLSIDDEVGRAGLEDYYDSTLRGENGKEIFFRNAVGLIKEKRSVELPKSGNFLMTSLDGDLQGYVYGRLKEGLASLGRDSGAAIVMNPQTGEVLSLVSIPSFNTSDITSFLNSPDKPFFNRAVSGMYAPGSTIKPLVGTAALTEGVVTPVTEIFSGGYIEIPNPYNPELPSRFLDYKPNGWVNIYSALAKSSNIYFYEVAGGFENQKGMGIDKLNEWWKRFNLGEKTGIDIVGESNGFLPDPEWKEEKTSDIWRVGDTYNVSIGQGDLLVTPISLLNYINTVANGGIIYRPQIVKEIKNIDGEVIQEIKPFIINDISGIAGSAIYEVRKGMRDVVAKSYGTAYSLHNLPFSAAAKTGTSQIENNARINAFFVGFAPFENPEISILILVENAKEGSVNTIPIAYDIFLWYYENRLKN